MNEKLMIVSALIGMFGLGVLVGSLFCVAVYKNRWIKRGYLEGHDVGMAEQDAAMRSQIAQMEETQKQFYEMKPEVDEIALYLREFYKEEIALGRHAGRKLGAIVTGYLGVERKLSERELTKGR